MTTSKVEEYCCGFCFGVETKRVVLILKTHPEPQRGLLNGIGGRIEEGEPPVVAMIREFREETGVWTDGIGWAHFVTLNYLGARVWFFRRFDDAALWSARTIQKESVSVESIDALQYRDIVADLKWLIPMAFDPYISEGGLIFSAKVPLQSPQEEEHHS